MACMWVRAVLIRLLVICTAQTVENSDEAEAAYPMRYTSISGLVSGMVNLHINKELGFNIMP